MFKFDVSEPRCVHQNAGFGLIEHAFHDDAAAVVLKAAPLHPCLGAGTLVLDGDAEGDGVAGCEAQGHVLHLAREVHGVVFSRSVDDLIHGGCVDFAPANADGVEEGRAGVDQGLAGARLRAAPTLNDGRKINAHQNVGFNRLLHRRALKGKDRNGAVQGHAGNKTTNR